MKIAVVFDEAATAQSAEVLIQHVTTDQSSVTEMRSFAELDQPGPGLAFAQSAAQTDILILALRDDHVLPPHIQFWLGLYLGLRGEGLNGAVVTLITKGDYAVDPNSSLQDYLETVAAIGGMAFCSPASPSGKSKPVRQRSSRRSSRPCNLRRQPLTAWPGRGRG